MRLLVESKFTHNASGAIYYVFNSYDVFLKVAKLLFFAVNPRSFYFYIEEKTVW